MKSMIKEFKNIYNVMNIHKNKKLYSEITIKDFKDIFYFIKGYEHRFVVASIMLIITSLIVLPIPWLTKIAIDDLVYNNGTDRFFTILIVISGIYLLKLMLSFITKYLFIHLNNRILANLQRSIFKKILKFPLSYFDENPSGYILGRIQETKNLSALFSPSLTNQFIMIGEFFFSLFILWHINWQLTLITIMILPVYFYIIKFSLSGIKIVTKKMLEHNVLLLEKTQEIFSGIRTIKLFASEKKETDKFNNSLTAYVDSNIKQNLLLSVLTELLIFLGSVLSVIMLWQSGIRIIAKTLTIGSYIAFISYSSKLVGAIQSLASFNLTLQSIVVSLKRIKQIMEYVEEDNRGEKKIRLEGNISFNNVDFSYNNSRQIFRNFSFSINSQERIGVFGSNGSGKTTLIKLLLGLYAPQKGQILIDNINLTDIDLSNLREQIGIVSQDIFLFNDSVINNIKYCQPDLIDSEILKIILDLGLNHIFDNMPKKLTSTIGECGCKLSGGQKQIIALLRVFIKKPKFLIIDEGTSNLDVKTEVKIKEIIMNYFKNITTIIITHNSMYDEIIDKKINLDKIQ
ncbi:MAG: ABC transporter ATP-binding protein/permease [Marinisporobacter sp.]|jgi:ABC-type bacteriocin/lantibiotic exporter with double-glycine peptidase domain|nr:ABC transporter ATP-binding protein/permease [Marinisporobacter sp.]